MPRPFPFPLNIGTDICSIPRILNILKGGNGRKFIRRVLTEREREEGIERLDGPVERWRVASRIRSVLEWKRRELGLKVRELEKRRLKLLGNQETSWEGGGKGGKGIGAGVREELRRALEREIRAEEAAERMLELEEGEEEGVLGAELGEGGREEAVDEDPTLILEREQTAIGVYGRLEEVVDAKEEMETSRDKGPEALKQKRLDDADIMLRLMDGNENELAAAEEGLNKAAEFMAGRFAAKEAAIKAYHSRKLTYHSIAIHRPPNTDPKYGSQAPIAVILPETGEWEEGQEVKISISHDTDYATAVCLAFDSTPKPKHDQALERRITRHLPTDPGAPSTGKISETNRDIFKELDMEPEEEEKEYREQEMTTALEETENILAGIHDRRRLVKIEKLVEDVTEEDLLELFKGRSEKLKAHIPELDDGTRRGYGLVSFGTSREAVNARGKIDGTVLKGQKIICRWMGNKKARTRGLGIGGKSVLRGANTTRWVEHIKP